MLILTVAYIVFFSHMICKTMQLKLEAPHLAVIMALDVARICGLFKEKVEVQVGQAEYRLRFQRQCVGEVWLHSSSEGGACLLALVLKGRKKELALSPSAC